MSKSEPIPADSEASDEDLLESAQAAGEGDLRAFEALVGRHQRRILADCRFMTRDPASAEDLAQEVFVKAYFGLRGFEGRSSFRHWLQRIKVHHCLNFLKKQEATARVPLEEEVVSDEQAADEQYEAESDRERIARTLEGLPSSLRLPLIMRDMDELSYEQIAEELGLGLSAVKMRIKRAREEFRRRYTAAVRRSGASVLAGSR
ncbi:MAG TPA: sigma-70 family RNA polymerase sigma factor [Bryobacteraceae bacterium]|nr:sigma-70 family RNA polymerase sigma factor [Bryobacteraceae bacterium]